MQNRNQTLAFTPPHTRSSHTILNYYESLMYLSYKYPKFMKYFIYFMGTASITLLASTWAIPPLGAATTTVALLSLAGGGGFLLSSFSGVLQHHVFGFPEDHLPAYQSSKFNYGSAHAEMIANDKNIPLLKIEAKNHYDAGFVEGFILAKAMQINLKQLNRIYKIISPFAGIPRKDKDLLPYLADILQTIPEDYQIEMHGKVAGYNEWLKKNNPKAKPLSFERYLVMQLLPDLRNYNPFSKKIKRNLLPSLACTTIAIRLGDYTLFTRILDWPSYGVAGKYFLQIDRNIADSKRTIDLSHPLTSGALTVLNENNVLIEINISDGDKVKKAEGMPSLFFNRYCAEHANNVNDIKAIIDVKRPLGAYHMTASDGIETNSFHFYQSDSSHGEHFIEVLKQGKSDPQLLVVANQGLQFDDDKPKLTNHRDSMERKENVHSFFHTCLNKDLKNYIQKQEREALSPADILQLKKMCLQIARLALVNNCESVLCAIYVYYKGQLLDACAATDNLYAPSKELSEFKQLKI